MLHRPLAEQHWKDVVRSMNISLAETDVSSLILISQNHKTSCNPCIIADEIHNADWYNVLYKHFWAIGRSKEENHRAVVGGG